MLGDRVGGGTFLRFTQARTVMQPLLSNVSTKSIPNAPRDLLSRLYREIGISAVVAALEVSEDALKQRADSDIRRASPAAKAA